MTFHQAIILLVLIVSTIAGFPPAQAHDSRPLFVQAEETSANVVRLSWKSPPSIDPAQAPLVILGPSCTPIKSATDTHKLSGLMLYNCPQGISGEAISINYPLFNPSLSTLIRVTFEGGEQHTKILTPKMNEWRIPQKETFSDVSHSYFKIGVLHILGGFDHLLFLVALVFIVRKPRRILITATGFTIAHAFTIVLVALNLVAVSVPAVETVIALSAVFLAYEIVRNNHESLTWRHPVLVASAFGLVHGAGFAVALLEFGLPQTEKLAALLFFNLGVEAGQLAIASAIFISGWAIIRFGKPLFQLKISPSLQTIFGYSLGSISAVWFLQRLSAALL